MKRCRVQKYLEKKYSCYGAFPIEYLADEFHLDYDELCGIKQSYDIKPTTKFVSFEVLSYIIENMYMAEKLDYVG